MLKLLLILAALPQQKIALTKPDAAFAEPFTTIRGVQELANGKVLVADLQDKVVQLIDLAAGSAVKVGREGQGPEEYMLPMGIFGMPDGSVLLQDMGNRRFLPLLADGKIGKAFSPPTPPAPSGSGARNGGFMLGAGLMNVRGADARGNLYFQGMGLPAANGNSGADSVPLMSWDRVSQKVDTVAWLPIAANQRPQVTRQGGGQSIMVRIGGGGAWPKQTSWVPAPDGRIAIVSPEPYQVSWLTGKTRAAGPVIPVTPHKVTEADKKEWLAIQARARPLVMTIGGGPRDAAPPRIPTPDASEIEWPEVLPPFTGIDAVQMTPEGQVWVQRVKGAGDPTPSYDIFDSQGRLAGTVTLRPRSRIAGFGKGTVYVVRTDQDDLQYLERYRR